MKTKTKIKNFLAALLAASMMLSLAACGGDKAAGDTATGDAATEQKMPNGDVLDKEQFYNGYLGTEPSTLDPSKASDIYADGILVNTTEGLTRMEEDKDGKNFIAPAGAEKWESNEDGTVWTFYIRDNKWQDGTAVSAKDYAYGIQRVLDPKTGSTNSYLLTCVKNANKVLAGELPVTELGIKAIDDKTLEITLESPTPYFLSLTYGRAMYPVRQDIVEKNGEKYGAEMETLVGNGPFKVTGWTHNSEIVLGKNEEYWDKENVKLNTITFKILNDESAIYNSFDNGSLDSTSTGSPEWIKRFKEKENVEYVNYVYPTVRYHFFNVNDPLFANLKVRQAFTLAVNREEVASTIYFDTMIPSYSWVPQTVSSGELGEYRKQVEEPLKALQKEHPDPKALLIEGMQELGLGTDPAALTVKFSLGDTNQWIRTYGEYFQQTFKKTLGVNIELDTNEWSTFQSKVNSGDYQMGYMTWGIDYNDPFAMLSLMVSNSNNIPTGWSSEEYDKIIAQAQVEMDETKRVELYKQAENMLFENSNVLCPIVNETKNAFHYAYVKNLSTTAFSTIGLKYAYTSGRA